MIQKPVTSFVWIAIAILAIHIGFLYRALSSQPYLHGEDGYYYALQADEWARTGRVKIPDPSPVHPATGLLQRAGLSMDNAVRAWAALALGALCLGCLLLGLAVGAPLTAIGWALVTPSALSLALHFPKQFSALALVPLWFLADRCRGRLRMASLFLLPASSLFLHPSCLPYVAAFWVGLWLRDARLDRGRILALSTALVALFAVALAWRGPLVLALLGDAGAWRPAGWLLLTRASGLWAWKMESLVVLGLLLAAAWRADGKERWMYLAFASVFFIPSIPGDSPDAGQRVALAFPLVGGVALLASMSASNNMFRTKATLVWAGLCLAALTAPWRLAIAAPTSADPDYPLYERVTRSISKWPVEMLVAHHGLNFYYKAKTRREAFAYEPEPFWDKTRVWRAVHGVSLSEYLYSAPKDCGPDAGTLRVLGIPGYFLVREDCWDGFRARLNWEDDSDLYRRVWGSWRNPAQKRPVYLYSKHTEDPDDPFPATRSEKPN